MMSATNDRLRKPSRLPTSGGVFLEADYQDQSVDQPRRGKRASEDEMQEPKKRRAAVRASTSPNSKRKEGRHTGSTIDSDATLAKLRVKYDSLRKELLHQAEKHTDSSLECARLKRTLKTLDSEHRTSILMGKNQKLARRNKELAGENNELTGRVEELTGENKELAGRNKKLASRNEELAGRNETVEAEILSHNLFKEEFDKKINLKNKKIKQWKSCAQEKDEEIQQLKNSIAESKVKIQRGDDLLQQMSEVQKQQLEAQATLTKNIENNHKYSTTAVADLSLLVRQSISSSNGSICVTMPDLELGAPASFAAATHQQPLPVTTSSANMVNFGALLPSHNAAVSSFNALMINPPATPTASPLSRILGEGFLPSSEWQDDSWTGTLTYA